MTDPELTPEQVERMLRNGWLDPSVAAALSKPTSANLPADVRPPVTLPTTVVPPPQASTSYSSPEVLQTPESYVPLARRLQSSPAFGGPGSGPDELKEVERLKAWKEYDAAVADAAKRFGTGFGKEASDRYKSDIEFAQRRASAAGIMPHPKFGVYPGAEGAVDAVNAETYVRGPTGAGIAGVQPPSTQAAPPAPQSAAQGPRVDLGYLGPRGGGGQGGPSAQQGLLSQLDASNQRTIDALELSKQRGNELGQTLATSGLGETEARNQYVEDLGGIQQRMNEHLAKADASWQQWQAARDREMLELKNSKIDPERWFNEGKGARRIVAAIAVGLGAFGATMPHTSGGGRNYALEIINNAVENDIKAQKIDLDSKWTHLTKTHEMAKDDHLRNVWKAEQLNGEKYFALEKVKNMIGLYEGQIGSEEKKYKAAQLNAAITAQQEELKQKGIMMRYQFLQAQAAGAGQMDQMILKLMAKQAEERVQAISKGETPGPALTWSQARDLYLGRGVIGGEPGGAGRDPLSGVPSKHLGEAKEELKEYRKWQAGVEAFDNATKDLKTHAVTEDPLGRITSLKQGTEANRDALALGALATVIKNRIHEVNPAARGTEAMAKLADAYVPQIGDLESVKRFKLEMAKRDLFHAPKTPTLDAYGLTQQAPQPQQPWQPKTGGKIE